MAVHKKILAGIKAFERERDERLHAGGSGWVAYHGEKFLGVEDEQAKLYVLARQRGVPRAELLIRHLEPTHSDVPVECQLVGFEGKFVYSN